MLKDKLDFTKIMSLSAFTLFFFFAYYGTGTPFQDIKIDVNDIVTENILNQILYTVLFLFSAVTLIPKHKQIVTLIKTEKFLFIFMVYATFSIFWSDYTFISFKRLFQIITPILVFISVLLNIEDDKLILKIIRVILGLYLFSTIIVVFTIPSALDPQFLTWRGFTYTKNNLGQISVISFIISVVLVKNSNGKIKKYDYLLLILSIIVLFGARSGTSILSFLGILFLMGVIKLSQIFKLIGTSKFIAFTSFLVLLLLLSLVLFFDSNIIADFTLSIGKDPSFTGRTDLWQNITYEIMKHPILGVGFQSFWIVENPDVLNLYQIFVWLPNQSHNGYLDMINELGYLGFSIFIAMLFFYFWNNLRDKIDAYWSFLIIAVLIINLQETTLFRPNNLSGLMFIFAYLFYFTRKLNYNYVKVT